MTMMVATFALVFVTGLLVLVTGALVLITYTYANSTKQIAETMIREYELKIRPIVHLQTGSLYNDGQRLEGSIIVINRGGLTISRKHAKCWAYLFDNPNITEEIFNIPIDSDLLPGDQGSYSLKILKSNFSQSHFKDNAKRFGHEIKFAFSIDLAGPNQDFATKSLEVF